MSCVLVVFALPWQVGLSATIELPATIDTFLSSPLFGSNVGDGTTSCCGHPVAGGELISAHYGLEIDTNQGGNGPVEPLLYFDLTQQSPIGPNSLLDLFADDPEAHARLRIAVVNGFDPMSVHRVTADWLTIPIVGGANIGRANFPGAPVDNMQSAFVPGVNVNAAANTIPDPATPNDLTGILDFDVTDDVLAWATGSDNYGWAFRPGDSNGGLIISSDTAKLPLNLVAQLDRTPADIPQLRPTLILDFEIPPPVVLEIDSSTGDASLVGAYSEMIAISSYQILSPAGALRSDAFVPLAAQAITAVDGTADDDTLAGNSPGERWQAVNASDNQLFEAFLFGQSGFDESTRFSLGQIFDPEAALDPSLEFVLVAGDGQIVPGEIVVTTRATVPEPSFGLELLLFLVGCRRRQASNLPGLLSCRLRVSAKRLGGALGT